jgi:predicted acyltransferase
MTMQKNKRLLSLDVFRGLTVAAMIVVNNPGDWGHIYSPFAHSAWNGCSMADFIFPFFLFIIGVSIVYSMESRKADVSQSGKLVQSILRRTFVLLFLGLLFSGFPYYNLSTIRIPGVLARISLVFGICGLLYVYTNRKTQLAAFWAILVIYYLLMTAVPVPGLGYATLDAKTNLGAWLDRTILGEAHLWKESIVWDPEGILGTLPSVATGLFGILIGTWLKRTDRDDTTKVAWMFTAGLAAVFAGLLWAQLFPINKSLWTSSYVLYTGGWACMVLALFYWLIDVQGYKRFTAPFAAYGLNAIVVYFFSQVMARSMNMYKLKMPEGEMSLKDYLYKGAFEPYLSPYNASLMFGLALTLFWFCILWVMYKRKIIIKV